MEDLWIALAGAFVGGAITGATNLVASWRQRIRASKDVRFDRRAVLTADFLASIETAQRSAMRDLMPNGYPIPHAMVDEDSYRPLLLDAAHKRLQLAIVFPHVIVERSGILLYKLKRLGMSDFESALQLDQEISVAIEDFISAVRVEMETGANRPQAFREHGIRKMLARGRKQSKPPSLAARTDTGGK